MNKYTKLFASLCGISLAEIMACLPDIDAVTQVLKLLVQVLLLVAALVQVIDLWREKRKKSKTEIE